MPQLLDWLRAFSPDIVLLQETKVLNEQFPTMEIEELGYNIALHGQKTYNGVAILSKGTLEDVVTRLPGDDNDEQARYIEAVTTIGSTVLRAASVYVPNGQDAGSDKFTYKLFFLDRLQRHLHSLARLEEIMIVGGDYNVAPAARDVYDAKSLDGTVCYHPEERRRFRSLLNLGLVDAYRALHPDRHQFSWWDYRGGGWQHNKGMRIDHLLLSPQAADRLRGADIEQKLRGEEKASDHVPVWCEIAA